MDNRLLKYFTEKFPSDNLSEIIQRIENDAILKKEFSQMQNLIAVSELLPQMINREEGLRNYKFLESKVKPNMLRIYSFTLMKYSAIAIILIVTSVWSTLYFNNISKESNLNTLYVPTGQRSQITLQDGTIVWVNANSTLKYPSNFSKKNRNVELIGEAFFEVVENTKKPFVVTTQNIEMKVLGTKFNVYSYSDADYIKTDLVDGSLMIYNKKTPKTNIILKPNEHIIIKKDQMYIGEIQNTDYFLWKDGIYSFDNERLIDIFEKIQLYYDVKIIVQDPELFNAYFTGKFRQRDGIEEILRIIQQVKRFNIEINKDENIITLTN